jgi:hypothetical protein
MARVKEECPKGGRHDWVEVTADGKVTAKYCSKCGKRIKYGEPKAYPLPGRNRGQLPPTR